MMTFNYDKITNGISTMYETGLVILDVTSSSIPCHMPCNHHIFILMFIFICRSCRTLDVRYGIQLTKGMQMPFFRSEISK